MRRISLICLIAALALLSGCRSGSHEEPATPCMRTVLVYMEARNDLADRAEEDLQEMQLAAIPEGGRLLVYRSMTGKRPQLLEITDGRIVVRKNYPDDASAVDPAQMADVIADARAIAPASSYGMVLWSHSSGWRQTSKKSRGFGLEYSSRTMSVSDLASALRSAGLEFIFFDTCYMGCVEVAYELRRCADFMVGSVCEVPAPGMPYDLTLPALFDSDTEAGLVRAIDTTVDTYLHGSITSCPSTLSLIRLGALDALAAEVKARKAPLPANYEAQQFSISAPYRYMFFDFGQFYRAIGGDAALLDDAVVHERHTPMIWGRLPLVECSGLSVYLPELSAGYDVDSYGYSTLQWPQFINDSSN